MRARRAFGVGDRVETLVLLQDDDGHDVPAGTRATVCLAEDGLLAVLPDADDAQSISWRRGQAPWRDTLVSADAMDKLREGEDELYAYGFDLGVCGLPIRTALGRRR
jgi:hypothetical protein